MGGIKEKEEEERKKKIEKKKWKKKKDKWATCHAQIVGIFFNFLKLQINHNLPKIQN